MLVLSRKKNERIRISRGGELLAVLTTVELRGDKVRIGLEGPNDVVFLRDELTDEPPSGKSHDPAVPDGPGAASVSDPQAA